MITTAVILVLLIIVVGFLIVGGSYIWYYAKVAEPIEQLQQNQLILQQKIINLQNGQPFLDKAEVEKNDKLTEGWRYYQNDEYDFEFKYPNDFFYRSPEIIMIDCEQNDFPKNCPNIEKAVSYEINPDYWQNPDGEKIMIDDIQYCVYRHSEGAAGTEYVDYYYTTVKDSQCLVIHFTLSFANCYNFGASGDEAYEECVTENETKINTFNDVISTFEIEN